MLISNDEALARLENPENLATRHLNKEQVNQRSARLNDLNERRDARAILPSHPDDGVIIRPLHNGGRRKGDTNLDDNTRALIGAEGQLVTLDEVADKFNISHHHAHELAAGKVYSQAGVDDQLVNNINTHLSVPHQLAVDKLTETLLALDSDKIKGIYKAKDIIAVATGLSQVARNTSPLKNVIDEEDARGAARIVIYSPTIKQENHYSSIETTLAPSNNRD